MAPETAETPQEYLAAEQAAWKGVEALVNELTPEEALVAGYAPGWSVKDLLAHIAGWLSTAGQMVRLASTGPVELEDVDVDARNAVYVEANKDQPLSVVLFEINATRHRVARMLHELAEIPAGARSALGKAGPEHYAQHLPRLREWVAELRARRS